MFKQVGSMMKMHTDDGYYVNWFTGADTRKSASKTLFENFEKENNTRLEGR